MASFAKIGLNNKVIAVHSVHNNELLDANGIQQEVNGINFLKNLTGWAIWKQTFTNGTRKNYAGLGYTYDEDDNIFWPKKPYASWVKHNESASWKSPIGDAPALTEEQTSQNEAATHSWSYVWNEANTTWDLTDALA